MSRLKTFAAATLAALTIALGALAAAPSASALPRDTCLELARTYTTTGKIMLAIGNAERASYYFGKAQGVLLGCA